MASYDVDWTAVNALGDPNQAVLFGSLGIASALMFANAGSAFGTAKAGIAIMEVSADKPELIFRSIIPVVMASILGMYGMILAIVIKGQGKQAL
jgi:V-type H+-transporting ATPase proteolipid subunit